MSRTHISVALGGEVYQHHLRPPKHSSAEPQESRTWRPTRSPEDIRHAAQIVFDSVLWQIHRDRIAYHFECTRAPPETIILRAKMDIEKAIGGELIKARKRREMELFRRRWCSHGAVIESSDRAKLKPK
ncbi:uncharacterized protein VTP21DRAFT_8250 [Calcarisporiella thermophila]|uniref:uncharacterized protein n=1 Tax=Calcarisporiella thermophila TaxID=911321 RepID=UPI0037444C92